MKKQLIDRIMSHKAIKWQVQKKAGVKTDSDLRKHLETLSYSQLKSLL